MLVEESTLALYKVNFEIVLRFISIIEFTNVLVAMILVYLWLLNCL